MHVDDLAAKQAALQKSLSTALLNHQISELEFKVQNARLESMGTAIKDIPFGGKQPGVLAINGQTNADHSTNHYGGPEDQKGNRDQTVKDRFDGLGRIDDEEEDRVRPALTHDEDIEPEEIRELFEDEDGWRVIVIDASALIWALRSVRRLVGRGWEVIVPLEAIRSLDLLKKGPDHAAIGARAATRYIEHATRQHKPLSSDPSRLIQTGTGYKRGVGLRLAKDEETVSATGLTELPIPIDDIPKWILATLGCAGFFDKINIAELTDNDNDGSEFLIPKPTLFVANPPLAVEALGEERGLYSERGEGYLISQEAERFELGSEVLRDEEMEDIHFGDRGDRGRGRGRGRGGRGRGAGRGGRRGSIDFSDSDSSGDQVVRHRSGEQERSRGRGRGRGGQNGHTRNRSKEEPEREIKILLRRPQPTIPDELSGPEIKSTSAGRGSLLGSPNTNVSLTLNTSDIAKSSPLSNPPVLAMDDIKAVNQKSALPEPEWEHDQWQSKKSVDEESERHERRGNRNGGIGRGRGRDGNHGQRDGRGRGRGGRGGRGGRNRGRESDDGDKSEQNASRLVKGGFTLLQRPQPSVPQSSMPMPPPSFAPPAPPPASFSPRPPPRGPRNDRPILLAPPPPPFVPPPPPPPPSVPPPPPISSTFTIRNGPPPEFFPAHFRPPAPGPPPSALPPPGPPAHFRPPPNFGPPPGSFANRGGPRPPPFGFTPQRGADSPNDIHGHRPQNGPNGLSRGGATGGRGGRSNGDHHEGNQTSRGSQGNHGGHRNHEHRTSHQSKQTNQNERREGGGSKTAKSPNFEQDGIADSFNAPGFGGAPKVTLLQRPG